MGELNDTAIFGNEEKQRETASARRMRGEKGGLGESLARQEAALLGEGHIAAAPPSAAGPCTAPRSCRVFMK